jgi:hypothetical protein
MTKAVLAQMVKRRMNVLRGETAPDTGKGVTAQYN